MEKRIAKYEDFGAVGNGVHDDMAAIAACHDYANKNGLEVCATEGKTYYIGGKDITALVKTSTHWCGASFIIDDTNLENIKQAIFKIEPDSGEFEVDIKSLKKGQKKIDFLHTGMSYVRVFNDNRRVYIRKGLNRNNGTAASDGFIVSNGEIITDINWDYPTVTRAYAKSVDDAPIVIEGGTFRTIANRAESFYNYHARDILINRSNVTVRGITHYIEGEGDHGAPYTGFINVGECYNFMLENCLLSPHFTYWTEGADPGSRVPMGTYDISIGAAIGVTLRGIRQTKDITDTRYWGLMGSNFSKDVLLEDCIISRYDAHCGVTNATIRNCEFGHHGVNLIGFGKFYIENTTVKAGAFINLRTDYGSFFVGKVTIKNCTWMPGGTSRSIFFANNTGDHNFGYECSMPYEIEINGFTIDTSRSQSEGCFYILPNYDKTYEPGKPFSYVVPETVSLTDISLPGGRELELAEVPEEYLDTQIVCP